MNIFITGGAGFIGSNAAHHFLLKNDHVTIFDNFSRKGSRMNAQWLVGLGKKLKIVEGDIRKPGNLVSAKSYLNNADVVIHLAGQVAVTTSVADPMSDFEINAAGTLNVLESLRNLKSHAKIIYSSTNKVYGSLDTLGISETTHRYEFTELKYGINETQCLDFHSPYGCSKGAADQYMRDYSRIYDLDTVVFRQSCIYGPRQFGIEDQGWVAWFIISEFCGNPISIFGNGKQVRDILYIDDLINAYELVIRSGKLTKGEVYNIGGGYRNTMSVWHEFKPILEKLFRKPVRALFSAVRPGDQPVYISDIRKAKHDFGWEPHTDTDAGIRKLYDWIHANRNVFM